MTDRLTFAGKIESEGRRLRGSITLAGSRTFRDGEFLQIDPKALMRADASNVMGTLDHDPGKLIGRTFNNTLSIERTDDGISFETAELPNTTYANDALELAKGGYYGGASFAIEGIRSKFATDPETGIRVRTINSIKRLVDVAIVMDPAFTSSAAAFSKETDVTDEIETPEPKAAPPPAVIENKGADWAKFAQTIETSTLIEQMDNIMEFHKADLKGDALEQYEAFAGELQRRRFADSDSKRRQEQAMVMHQMLLGRVAKSPATEVFASDDYRAAFTRYLRTGDKALVEQFAGQTIAGDGTQGGYAVPDGFLNRITEVQTSFGGVSGVAETITTSDGIPLRWPSNDDTANSASIADEGVAGTGGADLVFGSVTLGAYSYDATGAGNVPLLVSKELLQDAAFDIEAFVGRKLGERIARKQAADFATGTGTGEPLGLFAKTPDTMTASTMLAALIEHIFQVDAYYRTGGNASWLLSDTTLAKVYASVDGAGRPLFMPNADASGAGRPAGTLLGYPARIDTGAGDLVAFGDLREGYIIRRVRGVQVDVDPYTNIKTRQLAFHAWARADANVNNSAAYSVSDYTGVSADT